VASDGDRGGVSTAYTEEELQQLYRWQNLQQREGWYATFVWEMMQRALTPGRLAVLCGAPASSLPYCVDATAARARKRAVWRDSGGGWRHADGRTCVPLHGGPPAGGESEEEARVRRAQWWSKFAEEEEWMADEEAEAGADGGAAAEEGPPMPEQFQIIAAYKALDALYALLRIDGSQLSWELVLRCHLALFAMGFDGEVVADPELFAVVRMAVAAHPPLLDTLDAMALPWEPLVPPDMARRARESRARNSSDWPPRPPAQPGSRPLLTSSALAQGAARSGARGAPRGRRWRRRARGLRAVGGCGRVHEQPRLHARLVRARVRGTAARRRRRRRRHRGRRRGGPGGAG